MFEDIMTRPPRRGLSLGRREVTARARKVRILVMDVDGVLTDRKMVLSERGDEWKSFDTRDGIAIALARRAGLKTAMVSGERSQIARARGDKLGIDAVMLGSRRKGDAIDTLLAQFGCSPDAVAFIGDDLLDIPAMQRVGMAVAVADAAPEVKAVAHAVTSARGGRGAVRECVERILRAQGRWREVVTRYVSEHGGLPGR
jgi:3-deoxy-D-manno-octulosonate 8-phosphate phosphatase (KDO 8-P phosphatase)